MKKDIILLGAVALAVLSSTPAWAALYDFDLASSYTYGYIDQNNPAILNGNVACAATSTVNSFIYLQNRYGITGLLDGSATNTVNTLNSVDYMNLSPTGGVTDPNMVSGKTQYIQDQGLSNQISIEYQSNAVNNTTPTIEFLTQQLEKGQDVEVGFNWGNGGQGGHWVTATGIDWNDANNDGMLDDGETAQLDFIDPWGGVPIVGNLTLGGPDGMHLVLGYSGGAAGQPLDPDNPEDASSGYIDIIVAESPIIPEPASLTLLVMGGAGLMLRRRKA